MKQKLMLIVNPVAGKAHYKIGFGDVMRIFSEGGYRTTVYFTEAQGDAEKALKILRDYGEDAYIIGEIEESTEKITIV